MEDILFLFFEPSETSQAAGKEFWARRHQRTVDVDREEHAADMAKAQAATCGLDREPAVSGGADLKTITAAHPGRQRQPRHH